MVIDPDLGLVIRKTLTPTACLSPFRLQLGLSVFHLPRLRLEVRRPMLLALGHAMGAFGKLRENGQHGALCQEFYEFAAYLVGMRPRQAVRTVFDLHVFGSLDHLPKRLRLSVRIFQKTHSGGTVGLLAKNCLDRCDLCKIRGIESAP